MKFSVDVRNKTETSVDLLFFGDIVNDKGYKWSDDDICPSDVAEALAQNKDVKQMNIHINSGGGSVFAGNAIYNRLKAHSAHKTVYIDGLAGSIASVIALAGDEIVMPKNTYMMIHKAWTYAYGNSTDLRAAADSLDIIEKSIINTYADNAKEGVTEEDIIAKMEAETWLTAEDCAEMFEKVCVKGEIKAMNSISGITDLSFKNAPFTQNGKADEDKPEDESIKNGLDLDMLENFIFAERSKMND